ncbi:MAG: radical SAM protein [Thermoplasmata archaeon]|nr:radical SAM protein [Thermoplasmata archaeon]
MKDSKQNLSNYFSILRGERLPAFLAEAAQGIDSDLTEDMPTLWADHDTFLEAEGKTADPGNTLIDLKIELARRIMESCHLCERACGVNRLAGEKGYCKAGEARVASKFVHWGEEPDVIPSYTIFFNRCTFRCIFCQNWDISQRNAGRYIPTEVLSRDIERMTGNVRNINWVGGEPTPNLEYILQVLRICSAPLPQIWNSNMYMSREAMKLLRGVVDVYLSDFKYGPGECGEELSDAPNYWQIVTRNHSLANEHAEIIMRHLVIPGHVECCTKPILRWVKENLDTSKMVVNIMDQYRPEYKALHHEKIGRRLTYREFNEAHRFAEDLGLTLT